MQLLAAAPLIRPSVESAIAPKQKTHPPVGLNFEPQRRSGILLPFLGSRSGDSMPAFARAVNVEMDWLDQTSFEVRGTLKDNVHSLTARFVVSYPGFVINEAAGDITSMPYPGFCQGSIAALDGLIGERIGRGFKKRVGEVLGGGASCSHLNTLVTDMAACAFQMNYVAAKQRPEAAEAMRAARDDPKLRREMVLGWMPQLRNSCFVFSEAADQLFQLSIEKKEDETTLNFNEE